MNRLGDSGVHTLGDTSAFVNPASQLLLTRRGKTRMDGVGIVFEFYIAPEVGIERRRMSIHPTLIKGEVYCIGVNIIERKSGQKKSGKRESMPGDSKMHTNAPSSMFGHHQSAHLVHRVDTTLASPR